MPVLARFCGIVVRMLFTPLVEARFSAFYGDQELVVAIESVCVVQGEADQEIRRQVLTWAQHHQRELMAAWRRCGLGLPPMGIASSVQPEV